MVLGQRIVERKAAVAQHLVQLQQRFIDSINNRDWTNEIYSLHLSENFTVRMDHFGEPYVRSRSDYIERFSKLVEQNPEYQCEALTIRANYNVKTGVATADAA